MQTRESTPIDAGATVEATLLRFPQTAAVFFDRHMACVGCVMSCFDTLADAARIYGMPIEALLADIEALANGAPRATRETEP